MSGLAGVRVRFAPSPTGHMHLGTLRTALFNYLFARRHGGKFILRIEDTDQERKVPGSQEAIQRLLEWSGLSVDEGPDTPGSVGPYLQSQRLPLYRQYADELLAEGSAYRCFCDAQRLDVVRSLARVEGRTTAYDRFCRELPADVVQQNLEEGTPHVVRLKMPLQGETTVHDLVYGTVTFDNKLIDDQILMKSDGFPTYHHANVVDDHLMGITHVLRGEEWMSSTPKHLLMYNAFGWEPPRFGHLPLLLNENRGKLSKRTGGMTVDDLRDEGYLPTALCNFVAFLGWQPPEGREIFANVNELAQVFDLDQVSKAPGAVDMRKLAWINRRHLREVKECAEKLSVVLPLVSEAAQRLHAGDCEDPCLLEDGYIQKVLIACCETVDKAADVASENPYFWTTPDLVSCGLLQKLAKLWTPSVESVVLHVLTSLDETIESATVLDAALAKALVCEAAEAHGLQMKHMLPVLRFSLSGMKKGPGVFDIMATLGPQRVVDRLHAARQVVAEAQLSG